MRSPDTIRDTLLEAVRSFKYSKRDDVILAGDMNAILRRLFPNEGHLKVPFGLDSCRSEKGRTVAGSVLRPAVGSQQYELQTFRTPGGHLASALFESKK